MRRLTRAALAIGRDEKGAVLPLMAFILVTLLVFAAFATDLGAAWAERRTDQGGADAAVMAGGIELAVGTATSPAVVDVVRDYVERNVGLPANSPDWLTCLDPDRYAPLTDSDGNVIDCISASQTGNLGGGVILRVQLPEQSVDTFFASVIGIDTLQVDAAAEAELGLAGIAGILPFALARNPGVEECLGEPPSGLAAPFSICDGPMLGNFGLINSPWFGADEPHDTPQDCGNVTNNDAVLAHEVAIGLDHLVTEHPDHEDPALVPGPSGSRPAEGADDCGALPDDPDDPFRYVPFVLNTRQGNPFGNGGQFPPAAPPASGVAAGLIGDANFGTYNYAGRLRRTGGENTGGQPDQRELATSGRTLDLDNVGLWEYLNGGSGQCDMSGLVGTALTAQMRDCLDSGSPSFNLNLIQSPRFALVPLMNFTKCGTGGATELCGPGNKWIPILEFRPVYLQSTWYFCKGQTYCIWETSDATPEFLPVFNPGEGTAPSCKDQNEDGICDGLPNPGQVKMKGLSAWILTWDMLHPDSIDEIRNGSPFKVEMYR